MLDVSYESVNRWENGHYCPTIKVRRKIKKLRIEKGFDFNIYHYK